MKTLSLCFENQAFSGLAVLLAALRTDTELQGPPCTRLSPTQLGRRSTGRQTLPALDARCSFGHSKNADNTFVSLCVENF